VNDLLYIGSTTSTLSKRMSKHREDIKHRNYPFYQAIREIGVEKLYIELVELCPCNSNG
jgi:predicted GIY-YIG superfamily endonuclease